MIRFYRTGEYGRNFSRRIGLLLSRAFGSSRYDGGMQGEDWERANPNTVRRLWGQATHRRRDLQERERERESRMQLSDMDAFSTHTGRCWRSMHRAALEKKKKQKQKKITPAPPVPTTAALPLHSPCPAFALSHEQVGFRANRLGCPSTSHPSSAPSAAAAKPSTIPPAPRRRWR